MAQTVERERFAQMLFYGALLLLAYLLYLVVQPFLVELGWAAVLAICFQPFYERVAHRFGRARGALLSTLIVLVLLVVPAVFVVSAVITEGTKFAGEAQHAIASEQGTERVQAVWRWVQERLPFAVPPLEELKATVLSKVGGLAGSVATKAGGVARDVLVFVFDLIVTLLAFFFLLRDGALINHALRRILPLDEAHKDRLINQTRDLVSVSVTASLLIAFVQGVIGGVSFALLGIQGAVLWGVVMGIASLIPVVGTGLVWLPAALWLLVSGETGHGVTLLLVGALIIAHVDNVVRPLLLAGKATMNGLVVFISLLGGVSAFGLIGLVLGPLVVATATALLDSYTATVQDLAPTEPGASGAPPSPS